MNDRDWLNLALSSMHSGQWFGWKKNGQESIECLMKI